MSNPLHIFSFIKKALTLAIFIDSVKIALFVGIILNLINNGSTFYNDANTSWSSVLLNFAIPFFVSAYSGIRTAHMTRESRIST